MIKGEKNLGHDSATLLCFNRNSLAHDSLRA